MTRNGNIERFMIFTAIYLEQTDKNPQEIDYREISNILHKLEIDSLGPEPGQQTGRNISLGHTIKNMVCSSR